MLQKKRDLNASIQQFSQIYVPLKRVSVDATIRSFAANVTITQIFRNDEDIPIEAVYCFPIEEQAAIYAFVARIDDREIVAQLKEKKQAQREYNEALRDHHGAYMLEQDEKSQDNFIINVGALPPNKECQITISYVTELNLVENGTKIRFVIPTTIAPRYNPNIGGIGSPASTTIEYVQSAPYTIDLHCRVEKVGVSRISSVSHPVQIDFNKEDFYMIEFSQDNTHLDRDIIIDIELDENRSNTIVAVEAGAIMASFTPTEKDCQIVIDNTNLKNDFIFIIDCSGSMDSENKIGLARQAMLLFLKSLPMNSYFNIIRFGSRYENLFEDITAIYNYENAQQAEKLINHMTANLGGTELLRPLQWLEQHPPSQGYSRQIFLLTDGEISNVDEVLSLCRSMAMSTRIFSFGLGSSPSRSLIKGLARTTNGRFVFIPPHTNVDIYVGEQLQRALQPCITNINMKIINIDATLIDIVPTNLPPVFINDRLIMYAVMKDNKSTWFDHNITVELYSGEHCLGIARIDRIPSVNNDGTIARLAAKALILELQHSKVPSATKQDTHNLRQTQSEEGNQQQTSSSNNEEKLTQAIINERIIQISLQQNILSSLTAFIGIEKRINTSNADMVLREVPIEISADNQYLKYLNTQISQMRRKQAQSQMRSAYARDRHYFDVVRQKHDEVQYRLQESEQRYHDCQHRSMKARNDFDKTRMDHERCRDLVIQAEKSLDRAETNYNEQKSRLNDIEHQCEKVEQNYHEARARYDRAEQNVKMLENEFFSSNICNESVSQDDKTSAQILLVEAEQSLQHWRDQQASAQESEKRQICDLHSAQRDVEEARQSKLECQYRMQQVEHSMQQARESVMHCQDEKQAAQQSLHQSHELRRRCEHELRFIDMQNQMDQTSLSDDDNDKLTSDIHYTETLLRYEHEKKSSNTPRRVVRDDDQAREDIVRDLIRKQKFDGLWNAVDAQIIKKLTNKSLEDFQQLNNIEILMSAIIVVVLETRFSSLSSLWYGIVQKARKCLVDMLDKDKN